MPASLRVLVLAAKQWNANQDLRWGAALAYYALFSVAPLLVLAISIAGFVFGEEAARGQLKHELASTLGEEPAAAIQGLLANANEKKGGVLASALSFGVLVFGALGVFLQLRNALCTIWKLD